MVTVTGVESRKNSKGEAFAVLILQGDLQIVTSQTTGKPYATVHKISVPCTFDEKVAEAMVGKKLPGEIQKVECEPYDYANRTTGEVMTLTHSYIYNPDPSNLEEVIAGAPAF
ncbi:MAG: hypothetical protein NTY88_11370 [Bacteroidetes bacterium]|nr:hypothetical protein [Bacteroidota bacterium]